MPFEDTEKELAWEAARTGGLERQSATCRNRPTGLKRSGFRTPDGFLKREASLAPSE
jgi:hypothetical protein